MLDYITRNATKIMGVLVAFQSQLMINLAMGQYEGRVSDEGIFWIGQFGSFLGVALVALGFKNTTAEKVADAKVHVANTVERAVDKAINSQPPNGFVRPLMLALLLAFGVTATGFFLSGCAELTQTVMQKKPFEARVRDGYNSLTTGVNITTILLRAHKITPEDGDNVQAQVNNLKDGLRIAEELRALGDVVSADDKLLATIAAIETLQDYLNKRSKSPSVKEKQ